MYLMMQPAINSESPLTSKDIDNNNLKCIDLTGVIFSRNSSQHSTFTIEYPIDYPYSPIISKFDDDKKIDESIQENSLYEVTQSIWNLFNNSQSIED